MLPVVSLFPIISLLVVLVISLLVVRIATVALTLTGLSRELARFQARSAFACVGFTTNESERVVQHPVRRRIIMILMLLGNAGIVTAMSSLVASMLQGADEDPAGTIFGTQLFVLIGGLTALWFVAHSEWIDRRLSQIIHWALKRWTDIELRDYAGLLHLTGDYVVAELTVQPDDWLADRHLYELSLSDEGVLVLGVEHADGSYTGAPRGQTKLTAGDLLLTYGRQDIIANLDMRRRGAEGNWEHHKAVDRQRRVEAGELHATVAPAGDGAELMADLAAETSAVGTTTPQA